MAAKQRRSSGTKTKSDSKAKNQPSKVEVVVTTANIHSQPFESDESEVPFEVNQASSGAGGVATLDEQVASPEVEECAERFVGRWNRLISQTNWEKGAIISQWRAASVDAGASASAYSDEAWARRVEGVTPQHVGRLRRVHDRFAKTQATYKGLYWTHFLAALDWDDAELWLEGASQSKWSISQMRRTRWEALGGDAANQPGENDLVTSELDEATSEVDVDPSQLGASAVATPVDEEEPDRRTNGPLNEGPDFGEKLGSSEDRASRDDDGDNSTLEYEGPGTSAAMASPFSALPTLPVDIAECMEQFKIAIVRHRAAGWQDTSPTDVCKVLDALRGFAMAGIA
jgi:hypothetical protein